MLQSLSCRAFSWICLRVKNLIRPVTIVSIHAAMSQGSGKCVNYLPYHNVTKWIVHYYQTKLTVFCWWASFMCVTLYLKSVKWLMKTKQQPFGEYGECGVIFSRTNLKWKFLSKDHHHREHINPYPTSFFPCFRVLR